MTQTCLPARLPTPNRSSTLPLPPSVVCRGNVVHILVVVVLLFRSGGRGAGLEQTGTALPACRTRFRFPRGAAHDGRACSGACRRRTNPRRRRHPERQGPGPHRRRAVSPHGRRRRSVRIRGARGWHKMWPQASRPRCVQMRSARSQAPETGATHGSARQTERRAGVDELARAR